MVSQLFRTFSAIAGAVTLATAAEVDIAAAPARNFTYTNPILPGWHSDPSCVFVPKTGSPDPRIAGTTFCTASTFLAFPGHPVYASRDLANWNLASHAISRREQVPELATSVVGQQEGVWAPTIRYRTPQQEKDGKGRFYLTTVYISYANWQPQVLVFTTTDPFDSSAWGNPFHVPNPTNAIDPDLFWDDANDGQLYITLAAAVISQSAVDLEAGTATTPIPLWPGTGGRNPEGPHVYAKDGWYYLLISEFGTEVNHTVTIARSKNVTGPYESYANNPLLTNRDTDEYFQTVGHADLFQDAGGNWWGVALSTRSGPKWENYPMGRETVLFPARWDKGQWPILQPVRGRMTGWGTGKAGGPNPAPGPAVDGADIVDFKPGSSIPNHWVYWRVPRPESFTVSPPSHPNTLRLTPSRANLTADAQFRAEDGLTFIARRQSHTLFTFSTDVSFNPTAEGDEVGISVFLSQFQHIDLGVVLLKSPKGDLAPHFRFRVTSFGKPELQESAPTIVPVPQSWMFSGGEAIRLTVTTKSETEYVFSAAPAKSPLQIKVIGQASTLVVSGGSGSFIGTLVGAFATNNGGNGTTAAYLSRWRYLPLAQRVGERDFVPALP